MVTRGGTAARLAPWLLMAAACIACGPTIPTPRGTPRDAQAASPLGPSYVLLPLPSEDDSLLGRVILAPPEPGRSLAEIARPNPCAEHLEPPRRVPSVAKFEDAQDMLMAGHASATFNMFGFSGSAGQASHFFYQLQTSEQVSRADTVAYVECCKQQQCGYGYVASLVRGQGEYAAAEETFVTAEANVAIAKAGGEAQLKFVSRRAVQGYVAAMVRATDPNGGKALGAFGLIEASGVTETSLPAQVKALYEQEKIAFVAAGDSYTFKTGRGVDITENEFVRRYTAVTGTDELAGVEHNRNGLQLYGGIALLGVAAVGLGVGIPLLTLDRDNEGADGPGGRVLAGAFITAGGAGAGILAIPILATYGGEDGGYDGHPDDHALSDYDARLYVERYNRALLRKIVRDVQTTNGAASMSYHLDRRPKRPALSVQPYVSPLGGGVTGTF